MNDRILLAHGSGGKLSHELVQKQFLPFLANPALNKLDDSAIFEASGRLAVARQSIEIADRGAIIVWAANYPGGDDVGVPTSEMYRKELVIKGVFISPYCFPRSVNLLSDLDLEPLISIRPIEEINEAFHDLLAGKGIKVLIKP